MYVLLRVFIDKVVQGLIHLQSSTHVCEYPASSTVHISSPSFLVSETAMPETTSKEKQATLTSPEPSLLPKQRTDSSWIQENVRAGQCSIIFTWQ